IHCGTFFVKRAGLYGFMPVYGDEARTAEDEGAVPGDAISFFINGSPAISHGGNIWTAFGASIENCLEIVYESRTISLKKGWNLISWNVDTPVDSIEVVFADILDCIDVVLGFEEVGLTYDPKLSSASSLREVDHFHGYWVKMTCDRELTVVGIPVPAVTPIDLEASWNLVSYLPQVEDSTPRALACLANNLIVALGYDGGAQTYDPLLPDYSTLPLMRPSFGYWVKINTDDRLVYPGSGPKVVFRQTIAGLDKAAVNHKVVATNVWVNLYSLGLTVDDKIVPNGTEVLAVASDGRVVGAGTVGDGGLLKFMPIYGKGEYTDGGLEVGEGFRLKVGEEFADTTLSWTDNGDRIEISRLTGATGTDDDEPVVPNKYSLLQNYPNPFNPTTNITFSVPAAAHATVDIYNILGTKIATIFDGIAKTGQNRVIWNGVDANGASVASGIYLYQLKTAGFEQSRKMLLMK
ncbi:MAG: T9SS type A sorting domain-containing protein, partial [candidate division Zixibacteria bacterium]|nr:T9SS type A sorting domain-containing protein [candidate division Zixibacteria bacterium]